MPRLVSKEAKAKFVAASKKGRARSAAAKKRVISMKTRIVTKPFKPKLIK